MIIITSKVHPSFLEHLHAKGLNYLYEPKMDYVSLSQIIHEAEGLIIATQIKIDKTLLDKSTRLQWIGRMGSGMEHVDLTYAASKNIACISSPEGNANAVAEFAVGLILNVIRNIRSSANEVNAYQWNRNENRGMELQGKTIGIVGYGNTGSRLAALLSSFEMNILAYDKYKKGFATDKIQEVSLDEILLQSDIISFHLPLTAETKYIVDEVMCNRFVKQPYLINTSRGQIIKTQALIESFKNKKISGCAIDVIENENLSTLTPTQKEQFDFLVAQKQVIITPHIAGYSNESHFKMGEILLKKLGVISL
jgi:D-3-phosphoglycerate dehydrogenase